MIPNDAAFQTATSAIGASGKAYDWRTDIPHDALDAKNFSTIDAWLDACIAQDRPGKIGSGTYEVDGLARYAPKGIYGYGDEMPRFVADQTDCWLYLKNQTVTLKGLAFEGFGQVLGGAVALSKGDPYHSTTKYGFDRFEPVGHGGTGLALEAPASTDAVGPGIDISGSRFINCESVFTFVSDTTQMGRVDFHDNVATGTFGLIDIDSLYWTEVHASGNEWSEATGDRAQPNVKQNGLQTGFKIGVDTYVPKDGHHTKLEIVDNHAHDIQSVGTYVDTNAAVFADVRGINSADRGDNVISFNRIERVQGLKGQEDSNAIYAKAWGLVIEGNRIEASGAAYVDPVRNGSEASGILVKPLYAGEARDIEVVGNSFKDMPTARPGSGRDLAVIKVSEAVGDSAVSFNEFVGGGNLSGAAGSGVIRWYGDFETLEVVGNRFTDVAFGTGDDAIAFHQLKARGASAIEVSNNSIGRTDGDYAKDIRFVTFSGESPKRLVTGHNELDGGHKLLLSKAGTETAPVREEDPAGGGLSLKALKALPENVSAETLVAVVSGGAATGAVEVDDPRFVVRDGNLFLRANQLIDYETTPVLNLTISKGAETVALRLAVTDVDEAPTAISVTKLQPLPVGGETRTLLADVAVVDPDKAAAFRTQAVSVSDDRFEVADGHLYLKGGQTLGAAEAVSLKLGASGAGTSVETIVRLTASGTVEPPPPGDGWPASATPVRTLSGTGGRDVIQGTTAAELIDGRDREDTMAGGGGDDTYVVSGYRDVIEERAGGGIDTALLKDNRYFLPDHVENLVAQSTAVLLVGNDERNSLSGSAGNDTLIGGAGDDLIFTRAGADLVVVAVDGGNDVVADFSAADRLSIAGQPFGSFKEIQAAFAQVGNDAVLAFEGGSVTLRNTRVEALSEQQFDFAGRAEVAAVGAGPAGTQGGGTSAREWVGGTAGNDLIDAKGSADVMQGGAGDDTYVVDDAGDRILETAGGGTDEVRLTATRYEMDAHVENVTVQTQAGALVAGNASANRIQGGGGNDTLDGGAGADRILGGDGADRIRGGAGIDTLTGGTGRDIFVLNDRKGFGDVITDFKRGEDRLDVSALLGSGDGEIAVRAGSDGLAVYLVEGGTQDLVALLRNVPTLDPGDFIL